MSDIQHTDTGFECRLRDGSAAYIRPIQPGDKDRLAEGLRRLSSRSRYLRFHAGVGALTDAQLRYLTDVDHRDHVAWVALDPDRPDVPGMAVARYIRLPEEPEVAEAAITVADEYQGRGLGTVMLGVLARSAVVNDVRVFRTYVLEENAPMLALLEELGAERRSEEPGVYRLDVPVPDADAAIPDTPAGRVFRAAASGVLSFVQR